MQVSLFQALCLLPDGENFRAYSLRNSKRRPMEWNVTLEQMNDLLDQFTVVTLKCKRGIGYVITCGWFWVKTDGLKTKAYLKANGMRISIKKKKAIK